MTEKQILKLNPQFRFHGTLMVDYFIITQGHSFYCIQSGLRHAEESIKSPFFYEKCLGGKGTKKRSLELFTQWWETVKHLEMK